MTRARHAVAASDGWIDGEKEVMKRGMACEKRDWRGLFYMDLYLWGGIMALFGGGRSGPLMALIKFGAGYWSFVVKCGFNYAMCVNVCCDTNRRLFDTAFRECAFV